MGVGEGEAAGFAGLTGRRPRAGQDPELVAVVEQTTRGIDDGSLDVSPGPWEAAAWLQAVVGGAYLNVVPAPRPKGRNSDDERPTGNQPQPWKPPSSSEADGLPSSRLPAPFSAR